MADSDAQFDRKLAAIFQAEAAEHVDRMQACLGEFDAAAAAPPARTLELLFRATHSLKGAARAVGEDEIEIVCHASESLLSALQRGRLAWSAAQADALQDVVAALAAALARPAAPRRDLVALVPRLERLARGPEAELSPEPAPAGADAASQSPAPAEVVAAAGPDPAQTVRIPVERLSGLLHQAEELVGAKLDAAQRLTRIDDVLAAFEALRRAVGAAPPDASRSMQLLQAQLQDLHRATVREQRQLAGAVDSLLHDVKQTLLLPVGSLRPFLLATVRELARSQQKDVELRLSGNEVEMDRRLLDDLREPLVHLLRNAISHGIEPPQARRASGKPPRGLLDVTIASRAGGHVEIAVADDGGGIDTARLAQAAREQRLDVPEDGDSAELLPLVFGHGVSTAPELTQVSGRGIGLAIVRDTVERMGGTIVVESRRGEGTTFTISLTSSLATYRVIEVQAGTRSFLLPTSRVERALRVRPSEVRTVGGQQSVAVGDLDLPLVSLAGVLDLPAAASTGRISCLVLAAGARRVALAIDDIGREQEVLGKPVETALSRTPVMSGAAALASGRMAPILNVSELVRLALREGGRRSGSGVALPAAARRHSVLLAEDSITSRTLLKNILEVAGHRVEVAVDGAEALAKLREGSFDLVVSDVEMPRLDGIALTEAIRGDPSLAHLPVVLVTSLASPADRERGAEAGANAYIVKSSFDQGNLLQTIAELA